MSENLKWEKKQKIDYFSLSNRLEEITKKVVAKEMSDVFGRLEVLENMGFIKDKDKLEEIKKKINGLGLK